MLCNLFFLLLNILLLLHFYSSHFYSRVHLRITLDAVLNEQNRFFIFSRKSLRWVKRKNEKTQKPLLEENANFYSITLISSSYLLFMKRALSFPPFIIDISNYSALTFIDFYYDIAFFFNKVKYFIYLPFNLVISSFQSMSHH